MSDNRKELVQDIREKARQKYLEERREKKVEELREAIAEESQVFASEELTDRETRRLELNKRVLNIADEHSRAAKTARAQLYNLPDQIIEGNDKDIFGGDKKEDEVPLHVTEQNEWESQQLRKTKHVAGATPEGPYELVVDNTEQIEFVLSATIKGDDFQKEQLSSSEKSERLTKFEAIQAARQSLPVYRYKDLVLKYIKRNQICIVVGETGSGKTTQIPQFLYENGYCDDDKIIACTQPRRVAAMSVAARVSEELGVKLGHEVGYSIRFEDCTSNRTKIKYLTDGMLLRELLTAPDLALYSCIIIDEAHERTLHTDIAFGLLKDLCKLRPEFRLVISSATMDAEKFSKFFDSAPILEIPGRRFPVEIYYTKSPEADYVDAAVVTALQIHATQPPGDILIFLTGQQEIDQACEMLSERMRAIKLKNKLGMLVLPIYSQMPADMQAKIFEKTPTNMRKIVVSTNIAETSVTIDNIVYVIDSGFCKIKSYNPKSGVESLLVVPESKAAARQRAGRAGRVCPGKCFRLFTQYAFDHELPEGNVPEIQRSALGNAVLLLKTLGIDDLLEFEFMDSPPSETLIRALEQLYALGALSDQGELTTIGRKMAELPLDPPISRMLLAGETFNCLHEVLDISAMLQVADSVFYRPKDRQVHADNARMTFFHKFGDHLSLLNVYREYRECNYSTQWCFENYIQHRSMKMARNVREQLETLLKRIEIDLGEQTIENSIAEVADPVKVCKAVLTGFFTNVAKLRKGQYVTVKQTHQVYIHPSSMLFKELPRYVIFHELVLTTKEFMRIVTEIDQKWLLEVAPHYFTNTDLGDLFKKGQKT